ncbi:homer protein [Pimephales promelas]|nr:homer protein [Pimephales promelas]
MSEQPIYSTRAHVFQIDPGTKRNWIPASKHAVTVSFFYDANRHAYRIISVGGTKAIINSMISPNMTFTKTSQKFGQWADSRANTVYGLGFATENQLHQFAERFKEVREAARMAREKSQDKMELSSAALSIAAPQDLSDELQSPPVMCVNGPEDKLFRSQSADITLSSEKERIKKMLSEGSICEMNLEAELFTLQDSNSKLVAALHEANANVEQWKKQLAAYQDETERLRDQVSELEAHGSQGPSDMLKDELTQSLEELENLLKAKDEEIRILQSKKSNYHELEREREEAVHRLQELEMRNMDLERRVQNAEQNLSSALEDRERAENEVQRVVQILDVKIYDLNDLRQSLVKLIRVSEETRTQAGLDSYLLKPVQRITKYQLLLKEMIKYSKGCEGSVELQTALSSILGILKAVNDSMHLIAITGYEGNLGDLGRLLMQGSFSVWAEHKKGHVKVIELARFKPMQRHLFLHEKALLFCKKREESGEGYEKAPSYSFKQELSMAAIGITEHAKGDSKKFEIWSSSRDEVYTVQAVSEEVKTIWVTEIRKLLTGQLEACKEASQQRGPDQFTSDTSSTNRLVKNECSNLRSGGVEKQKTEEERGKEFENILEPGTTQRVKGSSFSFETKPKRQDIRSDPTPLGDLAD